MLKSNANRQQHLKMDFDESRLYFSHQQLTGSNEEREENPVEQEVSASIDLQAVRRHFREFLRMYFLPASFKLSLQQVFLT